MDLFRTHRIDTLVFCEHFGTITTGYKCFLLILPRVKLLDISTFYENVKYFNITVDALFSAILH